MKKKKFLSILFIIFILLIVLIFYLNFRKSKTLLPLENSKSEILSTYNKPIIPDGFHSIDTENAKWEEDDDGVIKDWNKGLVIEDTIGNQFVWIPVNLEIISYPNFPTIEEKFKYSKNTLDINVIEDKQILKYGGFYISRYEAGVSKQMQNNFNNISATSNDVLGIPVSQKGVIPWNYISLKNAKKNAENMYNSVSVKSGLPTLKQWQVTMAWLSSFGINVYSDSSSFGNYSNVNFSFTGYYSNDYGESYHYGENKQKAGNNMILSTGSTDRNMVNNIYDLAGNLWCYTNDYYAISNDEILGYYCVGGHYDNIGNACPAYNYNLKNVVPLDKVGFRVVLFL